MDRVPHARDARLRQNRAEHGSHGHRQRAYDATPARPLDLTNTLEQARTWYVRADAFLEGEDSPAAVNQRQTVRTNGLQLELFDDTGLLHKEVRVRGLVNTAHYNGRLGEVLNVHEPARYKVRLHATWDFEPAVDLLVHERHLERV